MRSEDQGGTRAVLYSVSNAKANAVQVMLSLSGVRRSLGCRLTRRELILGGEGKPKLGGTLAG